MLLRPNKSMEPTRNKPRAAHAWHRSPGREASGRTRQLSRELLPAATRRENQELKTDAPSGHGLAAALDLRSGNASRRMMTMEIVHELAGLYHS